LLQRALSSPYVRHCTIIYSLPFPRPFSFLVTMETGIVHKKWAQPGDWENVKPALERLYLKERKTLKKVMAEMREKHNFNAT